MNNFIRFHRPTSFHLPTQRLHTGPAIVVPIDLAIRKGQTPVRKSQNGKRTTAKPVPTLKVSNREILRNAVFVWCRSTGSPFPEEESLVAVADAILSAADKTGFGTLDASAAFDYVQWMIPNGMTCSGTEDIQKRLVAYVESPKVSWLVFPVRPKMNEAV